MIKVSNDSGAAPKTRIFVYLHFYIFFVFVLFAFFMFLYLYIFVLMYLFWTFKLDCQDEKHLRNSAKCLEKMSIVNCQLSCQLRIMVLLSLKMWSGGSSNANYELSISAFALKCDRGLLKTMKTRDTRRGQHLVDFVYL